jgi:DNA (cytosine-5)-methyltransferase 1
MVLEPANNSGTINQPKPTAIDLFCGAGGMSLGLQRAGFSVLCAADAWNVAVKTYERNFDHPVICADLAGYPASKLQQLAGIANVPVDLVVGGPPCQGFSIQRVGPDEDHRNNLVLEFARLVTEISPTSFIMENVPGLIGKRGRQLFDAFLETVESAGYGTEAYVVNAADYGVPQIRRRVIVFGWLRGRGLPASIPPITHTSETYTTVWKAIHDLPAPNPPGALMTLDPLHRASRLSELNRQRLKHIPPGGGMQDLPVELRVNCHKGGANKIGHRYVYGRLAPDKPASTITGHFDSFTRGRFAHPHEDRNITLREGARLQTFPDSFEFVGTQEEIAAQIGNAVPPLLSQVLAISFLPTQDKRGKPEGRILKTKLTHLVTSSNPQLTLFPNGATK